MQVSNEQMAELTEEFMPLLRSTARWFQFRFRPEDTPEECLGEVWQQFRLLVLRFDPARAQSLSGWVYAYLRRRMIDAARKYSPPRKVQQIQENGGNNGKWSGNNYKRKSTRVVIRAAMPTNLPSATAKQTKLDLPRAGLTNRERLILLLRYQEDLQMQEIAALLALSTDRVRKIQLDAMDKLRKLDVYV